ncbi:chorismate mutase [Mesorhizobium captivum]|uniref:chorismate mutase n=1 Tax=Mesorhizobium captivum TaxID=3072319 RepID=UPI002A244627|nr:chorismate mutase [Mesorhizobium sp. VK3C]MDX8449893.1 chorismate mutase [Mesorhizobium sp. VK3C]
MRANTNRIQAQLKEICASIANIDAAFNHLLTERFRCKKAEGLKAGHILPAYPERERAQIARRPADDAHPAPEFAEKFLNFIIREVIPRHEAIAAKNGSGAFQGKT